MPEKWNGRSVVSAVSVASFLDTRGGVLGMGLNAATRRTQIPTRCVVEGCESAPTEMAVVDVLPGRAPALFFLCVDHGLSAYESLWMVPEDA